MKPLQPRFQKPVWWLLIFTPLLLFVAGCHRDEVKTYRVAKDQDQPQTQTAPALPTDTPNPSLPPGHPDISSAPGGALPATSRPVAPQLTWKTPDGWTEVPPGEMRVASFKIQGPDGKTADVSVIPLPGLSGSTDDANVNRWRGQVSLSPASPEELKKFAENIEAGSQPAQLYDIAGTNPGSGNAERILGVIQHRDDAAWFFKMTGDASLVEQQKPAFVAFLKSVQFATAQPPAEMPPGHPPTGDMGLGGPATAAPISSEGKPNWQVPSGWQEVSAGQFLVAKFTLTGDGGATAAVNVSSSPGEGGGLSGNVNRWRGQLGLDKLSDDDVTKLVTIIDVAGGKASLVDLSGTDARTGQPVRLVGVIVPQSGQTWFYKLMGNATVVASQKDAFTQFVQGVKY
ncbi:MAG: hypothetical protein WAO02_02800 [Verrucomicrobiia bacterium]